MIPLQRAQLAFELLGKVSQLAPSDAGTEVRASSAAAIADIGGLYEKLTGIAVNQTTESDSFKKWFGNSKVRHADGRPMVLYHATASDFTVFKAGGVDPSMSGHAIWLTPSKEDQPAHHNISNRSGFKEGVNVMPLYARIERPLMIDDKASLEWARSAFAGGSMEFPNVMPKGWVDEVSKDGEYDGIIFDGKAIWGGEQSNIEYIVFKPGQLKSAIGNSGAFDPGSDSIVDSVSNPLERARLTAQLTPLVAELSASKSPIQRARLAKSVIDLLAKLGGSPSSEEVKLLTEIAEGRHDGEGLEKIYDLIHEAVMALESKSELSGESEQVAQRAVTRMARLEETING